MATEYKEKANRFVALSRKEATDLIGLLTAQLAGVALQGNHSGACPEFVVFPVDDKGIPAADGTRLVFSIKPER